MSPAPQTLERRPRVLVERVFDSRPRSRASFHVVAELAQEGLRRDPPRLLARGPTDGSVRRDDPHLLLPAVLRREALDEGVRVRVEPDLEGAIRGLVADSVEDDDAPSPAERDEARQAIDELVPITVRARVQDVVAVEEVEHSPLRMTPQ